MRGIEKGGAGEKFSPYFAFQFTLRQISKRYT